MGWARVRLIPAASGVWEPSLWAIQRVYLGAEYKGPHEEELSDLKPREWVVAVSLFVLAITCPMNQYLNDKILQPGALAWIPGADQVNLSFLTFLVIFAVALIYMRALRTKQH